MRNVSLKNRNLLGVREAILIVLDQIQTHCYVLYFPDHCRALMCRAANTCSKIRSLSSQLLATTIRREEFLSVDNVGLPAVFNG